MGAGTHRCIGDEWILAEPDDVDIRVTARDSTLYDIFIGKKNIEVQMALVNDVFKEHLI